MSVPGERGISLHRGIGQPRDFHLTVTLTSFQSDMFIGKDDKLSEDISNFGLTIGHIFAPFMVFFIVEGKEPLLFVNRL